MPIDDLKAAHEVLREEIRAARVIAKEIKDRKELEDFLVCIRKAEDVSNRVYHFLRDADRTAESIQHDLNRLRAWDPQRNPSSVSSVLGGSLIAVDYGRDGAVNASTQRDDAIRQLEALLVAKHSRDPE